MKEAQRLARMVVHNYVYTVLLSGVVFVLMV